MWTILAFILVLSNRRKSFNSIFTFILRLLIIKPVLHAISIRYVPLQPYATYNPRDWLEKEESGCRFLCIRMLHTTIHSMSCLIKLRPESLPATANLSMSAQKQNTEMHLE